MRKLALLALSFFAFTTARADQLIVNGGFEAGLTGWTTTSNGDGSFSVTGATSTPLNGNATVGARSGSYYAVSDDYSGSQTQFLMQTFTTPTSFLSATLSFGMFVNDINGADFGSSGTGAQVRLLQSTGQFIAFLYGPIDTFENPVGSPNPYVSYSSDIASYLNPNSSYRLVFSSSDSAGLINVGIDDVSLVTAGTPTTPVAATPEPSTLSLLATGGTFIFWLARRKSTTVQA